MDYKGLMKQLRESGDHQRYIFDASLAIETLLTERDAAVEDLTMMSDCRTCGNRTPLCADNPDACEGYKWRGLQAEDEIAKKYRTQRRRRCGKCRWYDFLGDRCQHPEGPCKEPGMERWEKERGV